MDNRGPTEGGERFGDRYNGKLTFFVSSRLTKVGKRDDRESLKENWG